MNLFQPSVATVLNYMKIHVLLLHKKVVGQNIARESVEEHTLMGFSSRDAERDGLRRKKMFRWNFL